MRAPQVIASEKKFFTGEWKPQGKTFPKPDDIKQDARDKFFSVQKK